MAPFGITEIVKVKTRMKLTVRHWSKIHKQCGLTALALKSSMGTRFLHAGADVASDLLRKINLDKLVRLSNFGHFR